jgi:hypothetical protein
MGRPRLIPSDSTLEKWVEEGLTQQQMVERIYEQDGIEVARSSVAVALTRAGLTDRKRYDDVIPWRVKLEHSQNHLLNLLRTEARIRRGLPVAPTAEKNLESFKRRAKRDDCVIAYVPESPDGWYLVPRRPAPLDRGLIRDPDPEPD